MRSADFQRIIDGLPWSTVVVELYFAGEPLLASDIAAMIQYARQKGYYVRLSTNALQLQTFAQALVTAGLSELIVSIDGASDATYSVYRQGGSFRAALSGTRSIVEEKEKRKSKRPLLILQCLLMRHNEHEKDAVEALARSLGVDHLVFKRASLLDNTRSVDTQESLADRFLPRSLDLRRSAHLSKTDEACKWIFQAVVTQDGRLSTCCFDWDASASISNVLEVPFREAFRTRAYTQLRKRSVLRTLPICNGCDYSNMILDYEF